MSARSSRLSQESLPGLTPEDLPIIIAVMGITGTGKSTFIHQLTNDSRIQVSHGLQSGTSEILVAELRHRSKVIHLVDTPGFDDASMDDREILHKIADYLKIERSDQFKITGLIYLHQITENRATGSTSKNIDVMKGLVGQNNMRNVMLVTNRWENLESNEVGEEREKQLFSPAPGGLWYHLQCQGASYSRYNGEVGKALEIIDGILEKSFPDYLQMQLELRDGRKVLETSAGLALLSTQVNMLQEGMMKLKAQNEELTMAVDKLHEQLGGVHENIKEAVEGVGDRIAKKRRPCVIQ